MEEHKYIQPHLSAYLRGRIMQEPCPELYRELTEKPLEELTEEDVRALIRYGTENEIKLYYFKRKDDLPRIRAVLGYCMAYNLKTCSMSEAAEGYSSFRL